MPKNWKTYKIGELTSVITKGTTPSTYGFDFEDKGINYIRAQSLSYDGTIDESVFSYISDEAHEKLKRSQLQAGDILFSMAGAYLGMTGMVKESYCPANTNQAVGIIRIDNPNVLPKFVEYLLRNPKTIDYVNSQSGQSAQPNINLAEIGNLEFLFPPLPEQRAIASILSSLDDKIELNLQTNKTLEEMAMTLYKHWFVDFGPFTPPSEGGAWKAGGVRAKDENSPCFGSGKFIDSELGLIPEGWEVKTLGDFINLNPRLSIKKGTEASFVEMKALPTDLMSVSDIAIKEFKGGAKFQNGDTLYARITPCLENGKTAFVDFLEGDSIAFGSTEFLVIRAKEEVSKYWTYCISRDPVFRKFSISTMVGTSGRQRVQNDPFLSYSMAKPPKSIFDSFTEEVEPWFFQIRQNTLENQTLTALRDTLLPKLISGEVRVKDVEQTLSEVL